MDPEFPPRSRLGLAGFEVIIGPVRAVGRFEGPLEVLGLGLTMLEALIPLLDGVSPGYS